MKVILAGGTGFIGSALREFYSGIGTDVVILTRNPSKQIGNVRYVKWNAVPEPGAAWAREINGADLIVNLTGKSVNCRWTESNMKDIVESRVFSTQAIHDAILESSDRPKLWINLSGTDIYSDKTIAVHNEDSEKLGLNFMADVVRKWESPVGIENQIDVRKVILRTGAVFGKNGGAFPVLKRITGSGLGGKIGSGRQYMPWIHIDDLVGIMEWLRQNDSAKGIYNAVSPQMLTNSEMMRKLRKAVRVPFGIPAPAFAAYIVGKLMGTEPELILNGRQVSCTRLLMEGFKFKYSEASDAFSELLQH